MAFLIRWDEHNRPVPELATTVPTQSNGGISRDGRTITYHIRRGVRWSDGAPFDADDVVFSTAVVNNPANIEAGRFDQILRINNVPYNSLPVGIGPFKFARWDRGKQVVLLANPLYWRGRPRLDKIIYKIVPDREALVAQLAAHKVDLWYQFNGAYLPRIQALNGYTIFRQPSYAYNHSASSKTRSLR